MLRKLQYIIKIGNNRCWLIIDDLRYMFCAENRQILAIVDWPLIGVDSFQIHSNDAYKLNKPPCMPFLWSILEGCQHQSMVNQQLSISVDSLHKTCNGNTPDPFISAPISKEKAVCPHEASSEMQ